MRIISKPTLNLNGEITIPASKSHTIRALVFASLADGTSTILNPLNSSDGISCKNACAQLGAEINQNNDNKWIVKGFNKSPKAPKNFIDVGNSGTTLRLCTGIAALGDSPIRFTGDKQIQNRPIKPLLDSLNNLGANCKTLNENSQSAPLEVCGKLKGGTTKVNGTTSQYLSSLLICSAFGENDTIIHPENLNEKPYVEMTLSWLDRLQIKYERNGYKEFRINGKQDLKGFTAEVPGDFSSATFPICAASMIKSDVTLKGLDITDSQGDKKVIDYLKEMGADIQIKNQNINNANHSIIRIKGGKLSGKKLDLNDTPDALPAMAVIGCMAEGETILCNVPQARIKETDRIAVMCKELKKMGADIEEMPDGLKVRKSDLKGTVVESYDDHRIAMALSLAGFIANNETIINNAECINITFPNFIELMQKLNANIKKSETIED